MENKECPYCGEVMDYRPQQHWTGKRFIVTRHYWTCINRDHHFKLWENL